MRALWVLVLCGGCYDGAAVAPCTLTCETASCPGDLVCGSDKVCQAPGMPACSTTMPPDGGMGAEPFYVKAPNVQEGDGFGSSIALSADGVWLVVGAPYEDSGAPGIDGNQFDNSKQEAGAAYLFQWNGSRYAASKYFKSPNPDANDLFGTSVAISADGNMIAVGAPLEDGNGTGLTGNPADNAVADSGAVFIFERTGPAAPWMQTRYVKAPAAVSSGFFGESVALSADGKVLAIGQPGDHEAWRYQLPPAFNGVPVMAASSETLDKVGARVALSGDGGVLFAGAPFEDGVGKELTGNPADNTAHDAGAVFLMHQNGAQHAYCKASNTEPNDLFGSSVAVSRTADVFVVGAPGEDSGVVGNDGTDTGNSAPDAGAVYLFKGTGGGQWFFSSYQKASTTGAGDNFGASLAITPDGSYFVVGAPGESSAVAGDPQNDDAAGAGAIYIIGKGAVEWQVRSYLKAPNIDVDDMFGFSVAISDDHAVIAAGAPHEDSTGVLENNTAESAGAVYVFR